MQNVKTTIKGNILVIEVDLSQRIGPSKSGKTTVVASSLGNQTVNGHPNVKFGLNVYETK